MTAASPADLELMRLFADHERFCSSCLTVRTKSGKIQPLVLSPAQVKLTRAIERQQKLGKPVRVRVCKAGQVHMSYACVSHMVRRTAFTRGRLGKIYAHLSEATHNLFSYYQRMYDGYQGPFERLRTSSFPLDGPIEFEGGGRVEFGSAETTRGGRSTPFQYLHLSETGFWRRAEELRTGLLNRVPDSPDTMILDESTANGTGNSFYDGWLRAIENPGDGWATVFFGWQEHPEYTMGFDSPELKAKFQKSLTDVEWAEQQKYNLTLEQLQWRRLAIRGKCEGDPRRFQQEFPGCWEEAFLSSGRTRYDLSIVASWPRAEFVSGELQEITIGPRRVTEFLPREDNGGLLKIRVKPERGRQYLIGADSAEGEDATEGRGTADSDYSVAQVFDLHTGAQVAILRGRIETAEFAYHLNALGIYFNRAFVNLEVNSSGIAVLNGLMGLSYPTELIYEQDEIPGQRRRVVTAKDLGFRTTSVTREWLLGSLDQAMRERTITIYDPITKREFQDFVIWPNGKAAAKRGGHDDTVIAAALVAIAIPQAQRKMALLTKAANAPMAQQRIVAQNVPGRRYVTTRPGMPGPDRGVDYA